jgi:hypothetical protein
MTRLKFILAMCVSLCFAPAVFACSCAQPAGKPCRQFRPTNVVFVGTVIDVHEVKVATNSTGSGSEEVKTVRRTKFKVEEWLSRGTESEIEIEGDESWGLCTMYFGMGEHYLVVTGRNSNGIIWEPDVCSGSGTVSATSVDVQHFRDIRDGKKPAPVYGSIWRSFWDVTTGDNRKDPEQVSNRKISLIGKNGVFDAISNAEGEFSFESVPSGKYEVKVEHARKVEIPRKDEPEIIVGATSCDQYSISLVPDGIISGRVVDESGLPVADARVRVLPKGVTPRYDMATDETDKNGKFMIDGLLAGDYELAVNFERLDAKIPYPTTFYPSALNRSEATSISLAEDQRVNDIEIRLTAHQATSKVKLTVRWADGKPVRRVSLRGENSSDLIHDIALSEIRPGVYDVTALTAKLRAVRAVGECTRKKTDAQGKVWYVMAGDESAPFRLDPASRIEVTIPTVCVEAR